MDFSGLESWSKVICQFTLNYPIFTSFFFSSLFSPIFFVFVVVSCILLQASDSKFALSLIGCTLLISVVFLIATLASGFLLPTNHHVLHWRCQTYYVSCLIVGDILLAIVQLSGNAIKVKSAECVSIGKSRQHLKTNIHACCEYLIHGIQLL